MLSDSSAPMTPTRATCGKTSSKVDAAYRRTVQVSFADEEGYFGNYSEETESCTSTISTTVTRNTSGNCTASGSQCRACRQTQRLRRSLKRIEEDYQSTIQDLRAALFYAEQQRDSVQQDLVHVISNATSNSEQELLIEQEAKSLRTEVIGAVAEREVLEEKVTKSAEEISTLTRLLHEREIKHLITVEMESRRSLYFAATSEGRRIQLSEVIGRRGIVFARLVAHAKQSSHRSKGVTGSPDSSRTGEASSAESPMAIRRLSSRPIERVAVSPRVSNRRNDVASAAVSARRCNLVTAANCLQQPAVSPADVSSTPASEQQVEQLKQQYEGQLGNERSLVREMQEELDDLMYSELQLVEESARAATRLQEMEAFHELGSLFWTSMAQVQTGTVMLPTSCQKELLQAQLLLRTIQSNSEFGTMSQKLSSASFFNLPEVSDSSDAVLQSIHAGSLPSSALLTICSDIRVLVEGVSDVLRRQSSYFPMTMDDVAPLYCTSSPNSVLYKESQGPFSFSRVSSRLTDDGDTSNRCTACQEEDDEEGLNDAVQGSSQRPFRQFYGASRGAKSSTMPRRVAEGKQPESKTEQRYIVAEEALFTPHRILVDKVTRQQMASFMASEDDADSNDVESSGKTSACRKNPFKVCLD